MKSVTSYPAPGAKKILVACLAALVTVSAAPMWAQDAKATATASDDEEVTTLTPFEVASDKDYGYLKTNAASATKIGMEIQKIPLNISVISREFLDDTNARSLMDLFRYTAAASGDTRFAMRVPANEATPQGSFTMRGFSVNTLMRNGIYRYTAYNLDNIDRVEIIKGPASVFYGQGYPGGVINYITKQASFSKIPTTLTYQLDDNSGQKFKLDQNTVLSKKAALRVVAAWSDLQGERRFEYRKNFNVTPSITFIPFESGKLKINAEFEYLKERFNANDYDWIYSDFAGWKNAAATGQYGSSTAFNSTTVAANAGNLLGANVVQATTTPSLAYATYINNKRNSTGDLSLPAYTSVQRGAYYTDASGAFIKDEGFNYTSRGSYMDNEVETFSVSADFSPFEWMDGRYAYQNDHAVNNSYGQGGSVQTPWADGVHWNVGLGNLSGYWRTTEVHQLDLVFKYDLFGIKNKTLAGFQRSTWLQQYLGGAAQSDVNWAFLPGATNTTSNPDYAGTNTGKYAFGGVPVNQVIRQRDGSIKPVRQIYSNFDPGAEIYPDISVYFQDNRNALDGYKPTLESWYLNQQVSMLDDRLTILAGYREEKRWERIQAQANNFPWYIYPADMFLDPVKYPENQWGNSIAYQKTIGLDQKGKSWMAGASFAVTKELSIYASNSKLFKFNGGNVGGFFPGDELLVYQSALNNGGGSYNYLGTTITSVAQAVAVQTARGAYGDIKNEQGMNWEFGAKYSSADNKIVGTLSFFRGERENQKLDDGAHQSNLEEPYNYSTTLFAPSTTGYATRNFRWRTTDLLNRIEGSEAEVIWTPIRNFQAVINGSWLWTAKTVYDKTRAAPGSAAYTASSAAAKIASDIYYNARIENVPEYRFNFFGKYTFTDGPARGASVGFGARYSSETVVSRSVDWNPLAGGYQAGDYLVFDLTASYPWEVLGYKVQTSLGIYNVTDLEYSEGSFAMSPARNFLLTNTLKF